LWLRAAALRRTREYSTEAPRLLLRYYDKKLSSSRTQCLLAAFALDKQWGLFDTGGTLCHANQRHEWTGKQGIKQGDVVGLLLDCDAGTLTVKKNGKRLGVAATGLTGGGLLGGGAGPTALRTPSYPDRGSRRDGGRLVKRSAAGSCRVSIQHSIRPHRSSSCGHDGICRARKTLLVLLRIERGRTKGEQITLRLRTTALNVVGATS
jgi:hypothetical protein